MIRWILKRVVASILVVQMVVAAMVAKLESVARVVAVMDVVVIHTTVAQIYKLIVKSFHSD